VSIIIVFCLALLLGLPLAAQDTARTTSDSTISKQSAAFPLPDYPVRVTLQDSLGMHRVFGLVTGLTADSVTIRSLDDDYRVAISRRAVVRVERQLPHTSIQKAALVGCLAFGGVLGLAGSQERDPDSPGIEKAFAVLGFGLGCAVGGLGGMGVGLLESRQSWTEVQL
jgi:hypothetical protein